MCEHQEQLDRIEAKVDGMIAAVEATIAQLTNSPMLKNMLGMFGPKF